MATPAAKPSQLTTTQTSAIRGPVLTYSGDSFQRGLGETMHYEADAIVCMAAGRITHFSPAQKMRIREIVSEPLPIAIHIATAYGRRYDVKSGLRDRFAEVSHGSSEAREETVARVF